VSERVRGLAAAVSLVDALSAAVRHEVADALGPIGRDVLAAQRADLAAQYGQAIDDRGRSNASRRTGALSAAAQLQLDIERLRARIGVGESGLKRRSKYFYGRFYEFGRRAQVVTVTRNLRRKVRQKRVEKGRYAKGGRSIEYEQGRDQLRRRGPNKGTRVGSTYKLRVKAKAARHFVFKDRPELNVDGRLAAALDRAIARAGATA
jgi:hypothetical protein